MMICPDCGESRDFSGVACSGCGGRLTQLDVFTALAPGTARAGEGFDPRRFAFLSSIQDANFWFRGRNELIGWAVNRCFPEGRSLLEVGCGSGAVLDHLSRSSTQLCSISGSDSHVEGLRFAAGRVGERARLFQMDARDIPFREEYDIAGAFDVIEHLSRTTRGRSRPSTLPWSPAAGFC